MANEADNKKHQPQTKTNPQGFDYAISTIAIPKAAGFIKKALAFSGPGYLVAVGYMDPGNWATAIAGGSRFGYSLLCVILLASFMGIVLQILSARLGIAAGKDLAQACRDRFPKPVVIILWVLCEIAICATDMAEVIGSAVALKLLFGLPLVCGIIITALDILLIMYLQDKGFRAMEGIVLTLIFTIGFCLVLEIILSQPSFKEIAFGFVPGPKIFTNPEMLYLAIGIIGATVMPHNLYLHSSVVQTRKYERTTQGKNEAIRYATLDTTVALASSLFVNAAILIVAAAVFHARGHTHVVEIQDAYLMMNDIVGASFASTIFALALLASGQNSTLTGTLAGQIVMEGFINFRIRPWLRRIITRLFAIVPAATISLIYGDSGVAKLLILSQVILCLQLPFAVVPLLMFTSDKSLMGVWVTPKWARIIAWIIALVIIGANVKLLMDAII